jgi:choline dehydrogenase-like flavoprotein
MIPRVRYGARMRGGDDAGLTREELRLRFWMRVLAVTSFAFVGGYLAMGIFGSSEYPFVTNSVAKDGLFGFLAVVAVADIRRFSFVVVLLIMAHGLLVLGLASMLIAGDTDSIAHTLVGPTPSAGVFVWLWLGATIFVVVTMTWIYEKAQRARYGLQYLGHPEFRALWALAEVLVPADAPDGREIASRVDEYLVSFEARNKWLIRSGLLLLAFAPLLTGRPAFSMMSRENRLRLAKRWFVDDVAQRRLPGPLGVMAQSMIRTAQQMTYLGYYGDARVAERCGYVPFSKRRYDAAAHVERDRPRVQCLTPREIDRDTLSADVVIAGSGAAGATLAYELARLGRSVLVLERGRHVDPSQFSEDEAKQFSALYEDGALTLSRDFRFQVAQGSCVGGSTVVNNGVCFDLPQRVLARWNDPGGLDAGIDEQRLRASFAHLREWLPVKQQPLGSLNPAWPRFEQGVRALGLDGPPASYGVVDANIDGCLGCGYCNIGCAYGKKLSMLDNTLPRAQQEFGDRVRVLAECRAEQITADGHRANGLVCTLSDGRRLTISAKTVVVSAGAIGSSLLLQRDGVGGPLAGRGLGFNIAAPLTADFDAELHSERGLQISHYLEPPGSDGFALETWYNPIVTQALVMPGWFEQHTLNMLRYPNMTCVGAVVGSQTNATVGRAPFTGLPITYVPDRQDLRALVDGLKLAGRIMLAAGALRVMPTTMRYYEITQADQLDQLDALAEDDIDLSINSAHPQGGNRLGRDRERSVADPSCRVHGFENLFVCDASIFPCPITVNPQLTVMALAHYAAPAIASA